MIYLAGAIERAEDPFTWRKDLGQFIKDRGGEVYDPCEREAGKLRGLRPDILPKGYKSWHEFKNSPIPSLRKRFHKYMNIIQTSDLRAVASSEAVVVKWDLNTQMGAGTTHEIIHASQLSIPVYVIEEHPFPAWLYHLVDRSGGTVFESMDELKDYLAEELKERSDD